MQKLSRFKYFELTNMNAVQFYVHTAIYNSDAWEHFPHSTYGYGLLNMTDTWSHTDKDKVIHCES